jgi:predicted branched-subunit amino acid permease
MTTHTDEAATPVPAAPAPGSRIDIIGGVKAMAPMMPGYLSFGVVVGAAISHGTNPLAGWAGADLIYGGSAQLTLIEMMHSGSDVLAAAGAALLINDRLLVYSSLSRSTAGQVRPESAFP